MRQNLTRCSRKFGMPLAMRAKCLARWWNCQRKHLFREMSLRGWLCRQRTQLTLASVFTITPCLRASCTETVFIARTWFASRVMKRKKAGCASNLEKRETCCNVQKKLRRMDITVAIGGLNITNQPWIGCRSFAPLWMTLKFQLDR